MEQLLSVAERFFHISPRGADAPVFSVPAAKLLQPETMAEALRCSAGLLKAFELDLPASHIGLGFFGLCAFAQMAISQYNRVPDLALANITFQFEQHDDHAHAVFKLGELRWKELPETDRETAVMREWVALYQYTINPVLAAVAAGAGVKPDLVWNQYGARMAFARDFVLEHEPREAVKAQFVRDYELLLGLPGDVFGRRKNPFVHEPVYIESPYKPGQNVMIRSSCCMYYRRENGEKCYNCPILKSEDRERLRRKIEAERNNTA